MLPLCFNTLFGIVRWDCDSGGASLIAMRNSIHVPGPDCEILVTHHSSPWVALVNRSAQTRLFKLNNGGQISEEKDFDAATMGDVGGVYEDRLFFKSGRTMLAQNLTDLKEPPMERITFGEEWAFDWMWDGTLVIECAKDSLYVGPELKRMDKKLIRFLCNKIMSNGEELIYTDEGCLWNDKGKMIHEGISAINNARWPFFIGQDPEKNTHLYCFNGDRLIQCHPVSMHDYIVGANGNVRDSRLF